MSYFEEETKPDYKFDEDIYVDELMDYITNTYGTHYSRNNFQATEFIIDGGPLSNGG